ncbi:hypothetical protein [Muricoccus aerilatus]|uniref:hypothetical protein n=1 Tax=Muricoccus aerilatus TaxID=452982 RepID=UPI0012EC10FD|nr:hypothetical protein [Roseomonas aerilata]
MSLEWYLDGVQDPDARWLALQQAYQCLEHQLATVDATASNKAHLKNRELITSALRRAAQELAAGTADTGLMPINEAAAYGLN